MRYALLALVAAAALALAGCGGSAGGAEQGTASVASTPAGPPTTASTPSSIAPTTTSPPSTTSTTSVATPPLCRAADLSLSFLGGQAATGHGLLGFALRNVGGHTCTTFGYPGIQFLTKAAQPLPTVPTHTTEDYFGTLTNHPLAVAPGTTVSFRLGVTHGAASTANCATAWALQVIPPNDTSTLRVALPQGAYECQTATVSPMQRGTSAYP
jgi:hypothetical protein